MSSVTPPTRPLGAGADDDQPARATSVQLRPPDQDTETRKVWNGAGDVLGTGIANLYGRYGASPAELRASAAAALAMAELLESDGWTDPRECYCCTCPPGDDYSAGGWDHACRLHGAHGVRACARHGRPGYGCDCGCGCTEVPEALEPAAAAS